MEQLLDAVIAVVIAVLPVLGAVVVKALRDHFALKDEEIKANIGFNNYYLAENLARNVVEAAEQSFELVSGGAKKEFASGLLEELTDRYNVPVSDAQIDGLIEAAVLALKRQQGADLRK